MMKELFDDNRNLWDHKTAIHKDSAFYDLKGFKAGKNALNNIELEALGDVDGKSLLHLQCHFGQDTLSWARLGAQVTGVDFSGASIALANQLKAELDLPAQFVQSNIYELKDHLTGSFDIVFTSYGSIIWLPDLDQWADVIFHFLKPGGVFYIVDLHPSFLQFDFDNHQVAYDYFNRGVVTEKVKGTYADMDADIEMPEHFWSHSLEETMMALLNQGLQLLEFKEFPYCPYPCFPNMDQVKDRHYVYNGTAFPLPHLFSLKMKKI